MSRGIDSLHKDSELQKVIAEETDFSEFCIQA